MRVPATRNRLDGDGGGSSEEKTVKVTKKMMRYLMRILCAGSHLDLFSRARAAITIVRDGLLNDDSINRVREYYARIVSGSHRLVDAAPRGSGGHLIDGAPATSPSPVSEISAMKRELTSISTFAIAAMRIIGGPRTRTTRDGIFACHNSKP